jgi:hypothetical protein
VDLPLDFSHLAGQIPLHVFSPDEAARAVFVRALFQAGQLLPSFPNQSVQPHQFGLKLCGRSRFAIRYHESEALY